VKTESLRCLCFLRGNITAIKCLPCKKNYTAIRTMFEAFRLIKGRFLTKGLIGKSQMDLMKCLPCEKICTAVGTMSETFRLIKGGF